MLLSSRRASLTAGLLSFALAAGTVSVTSALLTATPAQAATYSVKGIDVASWQHPNGAAIDWTKVRNAGYSFAIIKATESKTYKNPYYAGDVAGARNAGLVVGAYHFARPKLPLTSANDQARYFVRNVGSMQLSKTFAPVLDIENTGNLSKANLEKWMKRFLETVRSLTGRTPMIYSYDNFLRTKIANINTFASYPLWYANYAAKPPAKMPGAWSGFRIWQNSSSGVVPGISGRTDVNWFAGSRSSLLTFATGKVPVRVSQSRTQSYEPTYITGRVDPVYAGERVYRKTLKNGKWKVGSVKKVRADGTYSFMVRPAAKKTHSFRVYLNSTSPSAQVKSNTIKVTVTKPYVKASISTKSLKRGKTAKVGALVDRFYIGERVSLQKFSGGRWVTRSTKTVATNGRVVFTAKPMARTSHSYRVILRATGPKATATSKLLAIRVK